jgi:hypothetical protein
VSGVEMVKVLLQVDDRVETLWATPVSPGLYRLDNSPFWASGVSWNDVVEAQPDPDGMLRMARVAEKSGHRTIRVYFPREQADSSDAKAALQHLNDLGATYEGMNPTYIAVDIPPGVQLAPITGFLTEKEIQWEHADPTHDQLYKA